MIAETCDSISIIQILEVMIALPDEVTNEQLFQSL